LTTTRLHSRIATVLTSLAVALAGTVVLTATPAEAKVSVTDYGFRTTAFGTRVRGAGVGVYSGRTAYSYIACTRLAGLNKSNTRSAHETMAEVKLPAQSPIVYVGAAVSESSTFRKDGRVGSRSTNAIGTVTLGPIAIKGLRTEAQAWADSRGRLHASSTATGGVTLTAETGTPLDGVLGEVAKPLSTLLNNIPADGLQIPGLGRITVNASGKRVTRRLAAATARSLRVDLDSPADTTITIGRSNARIVKDLPAGVFRGAGWGVEVPSALGGLLAMGRIANSPLPCQGTGGQVREAHAAQLDPGNTGQLNIGALTGRVYGVQHRDGSAEAWTEGRVAGLKLGPLQLTGIVGRANVRQTRSGKIRSDIHGSSIGAMYVDGVRQGEIPDPGRTVCVGQGDQCPLKVTFFDKQTYQRGVRVTAVKIQVLDLEGIPAGTVIMLGNALARVHRR
jgi:hypothetical protein